jgi:hypothetical protein
MWEFTIKMDLFPFRRESSQPMWIHMAVRDSILSYHMYSNIPKDRLGDQRGWMRADKNSSQRMNSAYTIKDSHTILSTSCNHNRHTNPRNSPNTTQSGSKTQEVKDLGKSVSLGRTVWPDVVTVRQAPADSPTPLDGWSVLTDRTSSSYLLRGIRKSGRDPRTRKRGAVYTFRRSNKTEGD